MAKKRPLDKVLGMIGLEEVDDDGYEIDDLDDFDFDEDPPRGRKSSSREDNTKSMRGRAAAQSKRNNMASPPVQTFTREPERTPVGPSGTSNKMKMIVYQPMSYDDTQNIIDNLKNKKPIIVNLESLEPDIAQRILDFMSGAVYALDGSIHKISKGIFVLVPTNVDISGNIPDDLEGQSFYTLGGRQRRDY